jgi:3-methylcrotonyl-CoA carboxylase alpha subunit
VRDGQDWHLFGDGTHRVLALHDPHEAASVGEGGGSLAAPMPGKVLQLLVQPGAQVAKGTALLVLEAMKMEHTITAPRDGRIKRILFGPGEQVMEGAQLLEMEDA